MCNEQFRFSTFATRQVANSETHKQQLRVDATNLHIDFSIIPSYYLVLNFTNKNLSFQGSLIASLETCGHVKCVISSSCGSAFSCGPLGPLIKLSYCGTIIT